MMRAGQSKHRLASSEESTDHQFRGEPKQSLGLVSLLFRRPAVAKDNLNASDEKAERTPGPRPSFASFSLPNELRVHPEMDVSTHGE